MTIVEKAIPLNLLGMHEGEMLVGFRLVGDQVILRIAAFPKDTASTHEKLETRFGDWGRKWAGSMKLSSDETRESVRAAAMNEKFEQ